MKISKQKSPFPYIVIDEVIPNDIYSKLVFPKLKKRKNTRSGWDLFKGEKQWDNFFSKPYWSEVRRTLESKEFILKIIEQFEKEIESESRINNPTDFELIDFIENPAQQQRMYLSGSKSTPKINEYF